MREDYSNAVSTNSYVNIPIKSTKSYTNSTRKLRSNTESVNSYVTMSKKYDGYEVVRG